MDSATHPLWPFLQPLSETQNFSPRLQTQCLCSWSDSSHLFREILSDVWASLLAQMVKNPPEMQETWVQSLGWKDTLEKEMATHSSILAWRIPWTV